MKFRARIGVLAGLFAAISLVSLTLSGCVTSSLDSVKNEQPPAREPTYDLALRQQAVEEMRAKAEDKSGEKTNVFRNQDGPAEPLTKEQADQKIKELNAKAETNSGRISDQEMSAKQKSIAEMRRKLNSHYSDALKKIEN